MRSVDKLHNISCQYFFLSDHKCTTVCEHWGRDGEKENWESRRGCKKMRNMIEVNENKWTFHKNQFLYSLWSVTDITIFNWYTDLCTYRTNECH